MKTSILSVVAVLGMFGSGCSAHSRGSASSCPDGTDGCPCTFEGGACDQGLTCENGVCTAAAPPDSGSPGTGGAAPSASGTNGTAGATATGTGGTSASGSGTTSANGGSTSGGGGSSGRAAGGSSANGGATGGVTKGTPTSLSAAAVGAYSQSGSTCKSGSDFSGYAFFLCPGGRIRGGGQLGSTTELVCGSYTTTAPSMSNCSDKVGCFPKVHVTAKDTLILAGEKDVEPSFEFQMLMAADSSGTDILLRGASCTDGSDGYIQLERIDANVSTDYCVSDACPASGSSGSGSGSCGTDCDCGQCWYCESGTCRYGGEGPYGCYRGCSG
jgi:hypothetical protein